MGGGSGSGGALLLLGLLCLLVSSGCAAPDTETTPVPTFAAATASGSAGPDGTERDGALPTDCAGLISTADLGALLGLPLDSVTVRTTIGVAEPSVGRTERVACRYSGTGASRGTLLDLNVARYVDAAAASEQWGRNTGVESGDRRDLAIGAAPAALFDRARESVLMVTFDDDTLTFVLPEGPRPGDRPRGEVLVDLALRVLPTVGPPGGGDPVTAGPTEDPAVAAG